MNKLAVQLSFLFFITIVAAACVNKAGDVDIKVLSIMGWLDRADPIFDAKDALNNGEYRLWGVRGITLYLPGIEQKDYKNIAKRYGYRIIEGTSDGLVSNEHKRLNDKARSYAEKYNIYVLEHSDI